MAQRLQSRERPGATSRYERYRSAVAARELPLAYVDIDALEANIATVQHRSGGTPVRVATKSIRCRAILERVLAAEGIEGLMCYSGHEAAWLADEGFDDLLVAYPVVDEDELAAVAERVADGHQIVLMVDSADHVRLAAAAGQAANTSIPLCLDVDMSTEHLGIYFGVRRSEVRSGADARRRGAVIAQTEGVHLEGVMGYEGQIAGLPDDDPSNSRPVNALIRLLKRRSKSTVRSRRRDAVQALRADGHELSFVNGGGTGCVEFAAGDPAVTEVTVGSGFYSPHLFDHYRSFQHEPAAGFAIEVSRQPSAGIYTCRGGGYVASGPPGVDKIPQPHLPSEASFLDTEAAGEVQTPIEYDGSRRLELGDPVFLRHAKAGELCRNFTELHLIDGEEVVETVPTYRGDGRWFF